MKINSKPTNIQMMLTNNRVTRYLTENLRNNLLLAIAGVALCITGCNKSEHEGQSKIAASIKGKASVSSPQPLPRGKANFTITMGNFDNTGYTWNRIMNWTFNASAGTVTGTSWTWQSDRKDGKSVLSTHYCNFGSGSATCNLYTPTGWGAGSTVASDKAWTGTYTYNTTTGRLVIQWSTWNNGVPTTATDSWDITLPQTGLARVNLVSSNYSLTHGRGYGSNARWTTYKTISDMFAAGLPAYTSTTAKTVRGAGYSTTGTVTIYPIQTTSGLWAGSAFGLTGATTPAPAPANCMHHYDPNGAPPALPSSCAPGNAFIRNGQVSHLGTMGSRRVAYSGWAACLSKDVDWPCYVGQMHPYALQQIIDDNGVLIGFVGVETQNEIVAGNGKFQLSCVDWTGI